MGERIYTSNEYKRLGERIRSNPLNISEDDYLALQELRLTYKEPLAIVFKAIERAAYKVDPNCICTYRIKRIESIISKLIRFPHMQVNRAEDIAGCRCIMTNTENVYKLFNKLQKIMDRLSLEITGAVHDYIEKPKDSGYRSIHLNVRLKGDKRVVEIQLRALEHHNWATLVEITDLLFCTKLKELGKKSDAVTNSYHQNKVSSFCRYYQCVLDIVAFWIEEQRLEMTSFNKDNIARNSRLLRTEWTNSINNGINALYYIMWKMNQRLSFDLLHIIPYYRMKHIQKQFKRKYGHANH